MLGPPAVATLVEGVRAADLALTVDDTPAALVLAGDLNDAAAIDLAVGTADDARGGPGGGAVHILYGPFPAVETATVYGDGDEGVRDDAVAVHATRLGAALAAADPGVDSLREVSFDAPGWARSVFGA